MRALCLSRSISTSICFSILATSVALAQPGLTPEQPSALARFAACVRERRQQLDAIDRTRDSAQRARMADSVRRCDEPPSPPEPKHWRYDVRVGRHWTAVEIDENDTPYGSGAFLDIERGPRPRSIGLSLTAFASLSRFSWAGDMQLADDPPNPTYHFTFVELGARANAHLGWVRLGAGVGAQLGASSAGSYEIESLAGLLGGFEIPFAGAYRVTALAMLSWGGVQHFQSGLLSGRFAAGIRF